MASLRSVQVEPGKCTGCGACEVACAFQREGLASTLRGSIVLHMEDRVDYFGVVVKRVDGSLLLGRPEGVEVQSPAQAAGGAQAAKPIMLRQPCDLCGEGDAWCVRFCPTGALSVAEGVG